MVGELDLRKLELRKGSLETEVTFTNVFKKYAKKYCLSHHDSTKSASRQINDGSILLKVEYSGVRNYQHERVTIDIKNIHSNPTPNRRRIKISTESESHLIKQEEPGYLLSDTLTLTTNPKDSLTFQLYDHETLIASKYMLTEDVFALSSGIYQSPFKIGDSALQLYYETHVSSLPRSNTTLELVNQ